MVADKMAKAYRQSRDYYDDVLTQRSFWSRWYSSFFWQGLDDREIAANLLTCIPYDFSGRLLEVPIGTAVFTSHHFKRLTGAQIIGVDYSEDMLKKARARFSAEDRHIRLEQGDVGKLPFPDATFDCVLSMNGFHAFPDKEAAYRECFRVLKPEGTFLGCFYISGESRRTDWLVRNVLARKGWFTPPFETYTSLRDRLAKTFRDVSIEKSGAMVRFEAKQKK